MKLGNRVIRRDLATPGDLYALVGRMQTRVQMRHSPLMEMTRRNRPLATATPSTALHCPRRQQPWRPLLGAPLVPCPLSPSSAGSCPTAAPAAPHPPRPPSPTPRTSAPFCSKLTTATAQSSRFPSPVLGTPIKPHLGSTVMPRRRHSPAINPTRRTVYHGAAEMTELLADLNRVPAQDSGEDN